MYGDKDYECDRCCHCFERDELRPFDAVKWLCHDCYEIELESSPSNSSEVGHSPASGLTISCSCGKTYNQEQWQKLKLVGIQKVPGYPSLEMRDCSCKSTISVEIK